MPPETAVTPPDQAPALSENERARASGIRTLRKVAPYLWPADKAWVKRRVVWAMIALFVSKLVAIGTPFIFGRAVDAMGGDVGPEVMVGGAAASRADFPDLRFIFFGDETAIRKEIAKHKALADNVEVIHADRVISGEDKPSQALRRSKDSSGYSYG